MELPFSYEDRNTEALELAFGPVHLEAILDGEYGERYQWLTRDIFLINWSDEPYTIQDELSAMLTYMDKYGFEATLISRMKPSIRWKS